MGAEQNFILRLLQPRSAKLDSFSIFEEKFSFFISKFNFLQVFNKGIKLRLQFQFTVLLYFISELL